MIAVGKYSQELEREGVVRLSHPHRFSHLRVWKGLGELWAGPTVGGP